MARGRSFKKAAKKKTKALGFKGRAKRRLVRRSVKAHRSGARAGRGGNRNRDSRGRFT